MLRVTTLHASSAQATAAYYTQYLTAAPGEVPGEWSGRQAAGLGLSGEVDGASLEMLLSGRDPITGTQLGRELLDRIDKNGRVVRAVAGFDATFSAPKSLSVWWALTGDQRLLEAHDVAVRAALAHLERYGSTTRCEPTAAACSPTRGGLTMATFRQTTSRADDPQIHTHAVISAKVQTADGRWMALDARYLKRHQRMLGGLYQSVLRAELTQRFGVAWTPIVNGQAEIAGMPAELLDVFSKRSAAIDVALDAKVDEFRQREGRDPSRWERAALTREASADTRSHKSGHGVPDLATRWQSEAASVGWTAEQLTETLADAGRRRPSTRPVMVNEVLADLSESRSAWGRADVLQALCDLQRPAPGIAGVDWADWLEQATDQITAGLVDLDPDTPVSRRASDGRSVRIEPTAAHFTTEAILIQEEAVLAWATLAQLDDPAPSTTVRTGGLDPMQAAAAGVGRRPRPADARRRPGRRGQDTDARRRRRRSRTVTIDSCSGSRPRPRAPVSSKPRHGCRPTPSPSCSTNGDAPTARPTRRTGCRPVRRWSSTRPGCCPPRRCTTSSNSPRPTAGASCSSATHDNSKPSAVVACSTRSAPTDASTPSNTSTASSTAGKPPHHSSCAPATHAPSTTTSSTTASTPARSATHLDDIAHQWMHHTGEGRSVGIVASTNDHVDHLNRAVQAARLDAGQLDPTTAAVIAGGETAHVGDVVMTRRNDRRLVTSNGDPVRNRETWTVVATHADGSLTLDRRNGPGTVVVPADYVHEHVRLGYAATEHGWQGDTVDISLAVTNTATSRRGLYVAATRGRDENHLHVVTDTNDPADARDVLDQILAVDRADTPRHPHPPRSRRARTTSAAHVAAALPDPRLVPRPARRSQNRPRRRPTARQRTGPPPGDRRRAPRAASAHLAHVGQDTAPARSARRRRARRARRRIGPRRQ